MDLVYHYAKELGIGLTDFSLTKDANLALIVVNCHVFIAVGRQMMANYIAYLVMPPMHTFH